MMSPFFEIPNKEKDEDYNIENIDTLHVPNVSDWSFDLGLKYPDDCP